MTAITHAPVTGRGVALIASAMIMVVSSNAFAVLRPQFPVRTRPPFADAVVIIINGDVATTAPKPATLPK